MLRQAAKALRKNKPDIIKTWAERVRKEVPDLRHERSPILINKTPIFIDQIIIALEGGEAFARSTTKEVSKNHGRERAEIEQYSLAQVLFEYHLLRDLLIEVITQDGATPTSEERDVIHRMIDQGMIEAGAEFVEAQYLEAGEGTKDEIERSMHRLRSLQRVTEMALAKSADLDGLFREMLGAIREIFQTDTVAILLADPEMKVLTVRAAHGLEEAIEKQLLIPMGKGVAGRILAERRPIVIDDLTEVPVASPILQQKGVKSLMGVPLRLEGRLIGVMHTGTLGLRKFSDEDLLLLQLMADRISVAIGQARLYEKLQEQVLALEREQELRDIFIATLSHDLRTPLTVAKVSAELLFRHYERLTAGAKNVVRPILDRVLSSVDRVDGMIQNLLDASRIRMGSDLPIQVSYIDLEEVLREVVEELALIHGDRLVYLSSGVPVKGYWDGESLKRVIENLVNNAIKYGRPESRITIGLVAHPGHTEVFVHNFGKTLSSEELKTIFEPFQRSREAGGEKGWGLGLTLVKGIAEAHGGRVEVRNDPGRGTTFVVTLPIDSRWKETAEPAA